MTTSDSFRYFAYGSNMFTPKMRAPAPSAQFRAIARLAGYALRFNKMSDDGSGKGNIVSTHGAQNEVWGVIFEIADEDRLKLDRSEGGYKRVEINVLTAAGSQSVITYIAKPGRTDDVLRPYTWYKEFVVRGAHDHVLPPNYVTALEGVPAVDDPDPDRDRRNRELLRR